MRKFDFFLGGPLHGAGMPIEDGKKPATTYTAEDDQGREHRYRLVPLTIADLPHDVFVVDGYDLEKAQREAGRFAAAFRS